MVVRKKSKRTYRRKNIDGNFRGAEDIFMKKVRRHRNIGISILIVQIMGGIYLLFNTWQYPLVYVSIDYKIRKDKKMSNDFRFEIQMENLFLKHLKVVQQDFDLPEEIQEQINDINNAIKF